MRSDKNKTQVIDGIKICEKNRFTIFVKSKSCEEFRSLLIWLQWFLDRSIPAVIACVGSGYAVYRNNLLEVPILEQLNCAYKPCSKSFTIHPATKQEYCSRKCAVADRLSEKPVQK